MIKHVKMMHKQKLVGTSAFRRPHVFLVIAIFILLFVSLESANALEVKVSEEVKSPLSEGEPVSLTLTISDYDDKCNLSFETHLARDGINPFYVLPDLNKRVDEKSFEIPAPQQKEIQVQIIGRAPSANEVKVDKRADGLKIVKYNPGPYKYFEIKQVDAGGEVEGSPGARSIYR
ncbi:MAG: hypothetical protein ISS94_02730 [Candidatus Syntrophoarchaeum sp.]|nr:hypothetical protein [Methanomicrobia archaeon]MBL7117686.1 hypothetical protein [Candidatus Syntrophoarchaeum sp.]